MACWSYVGYSMPRCAYKSYRKSMFIRETPLLINNNDLEYHKLSTKCFSCLNGWSLMCCFRLLQQGSSSSFGSYDSIPVFKTTKTVLKGHGCPPLMCGLAIYKQQERQEAPHISGGEVRTKTSVKLLTNHRPLL